MLSAQLWSLRDDLEAHGPEDVIRGLAAAGFSAVEPFAVAQTLDSFLPLLRRLGMASPTAHGELLGDDLPRTLDAAAELGVVSIMHPAFFADRWHAPDGVQRIADDLRRAADAAEPYGMRVGFHNHDDEVRLQVDGRAALLALMDLVGPTVGVEYDPYWATVGGSDAVELAVELGPRILAMHLKDGPRDGGNRDQVVLGLGDLDLEGLLGAVGPEAQLVLAPDMIASSPRAAILAGRDWLEARSRAVEQRA